MRMKSGLVSTVIAILLVSLAAPLIARPTSASESTYEHEWRIREEGEDWFKLESDIVTVLFPRRGSKPMFIWWYTNASDQIYVVKFKGLIEWFAFDNPMLPANPEYYNHLRNASEETWRERFEHWYFEPEEDHWREMGQMGMMNLTRLREMMQQIYAHMMLWHMPVLPFDVGLWDLAERVNITTPEGKVIGVSFAFRLLDARLPRFEFADNNIMIRVRFYNETVEETIPGTNYKYTVNAGEMKMDLVINKWVWNFDTIRHLLEQLKADGFNISIPEGKSRLALWVNLASINMTKLALAENEPDEIEYHSTASHMEIEDMHEDISENKTSTDHESPIVTTRPIVKLNFANQTSTLGGFFRFVSSAKVTDYPSEGDMNMVPIKAAYIASGRSLRLFMGYPYFGNGTLEHDPSIGVDLAGVDTSPKYSVQSPSGNQITPTVLGNYVPPLFTTQLMVALIVVISGVVLLLYAIKWRRRTPVNMVGVSTPARTTG
jgi:hypothetical protein